GDRIHIAVRDRGFGIREVDVERIFGRFERAVSARHYGGLGLGLFIARQIVDAHGGEIAVGKSEGPGAEIVISMPAVVGAASGPRAAAG
ncbi:MAG TPA: sensor histidine kinase, partial [Kofleriaceae bacterium]|nr:sensor histidine kinase [Kofleriaceae bacterium]